MNEAQIKSAIIDALPAHSLAELTRRLDPTITRLTIAAHVRHMVATGEIEEVRMMGPGNRWYHGYRAA